MSFRRFLGLFGPLRLRALFPLSPSVGRPGAKLVIGLGNPGEEYSRHRHNVGWMVIDELARTSGVRLAPERSRKANTAICRPGGGTAILAQPATYMNLSGEAVGRLMKWYKVGEDDILIVYDDKDLPLGKIRLRTKGSAGSHNGMISIIQTLDTDLFPRLRVGIGPKPPLVPLKDFVLSPFAADEEELRRQTVERAAEAARSFVIDGPEVTMQKYN